MAALPGAAAAQPATPPAGAPAPPDGPAAGVDRTDHPVVATVQLASAGLHVIDRWTDALLDALLDGGALEPQVGGSLTGGRIEVTMTVEGLDVADAATVAAEVLRGALAVATTPGVTVVGLRTEVSSAAPAPS